MTGARIGTLAPRQRARNTRPSFLVIDTRPSAAGANQLKGGSLGFINPALYAINCSRRRYAADFHDITVGNNQLAGTPVGFNAAPGYDFATGLGTPNVANLIQDLVTPLSCS